MEQWSEIRRLVMTGELNKIQACRKYGLHWKTLEKILRHEEPPGYRQRVPRKKPKIGPFLEVIHQILESDRTAPKKQRHTAKRIFERLRQEHQYPGGYSAVKEVVSAWKSQGAEVFVPLSHPPGEAQVDYGAAEVVVAGQPRTAAVFVMVLPHSDAVFCCAFPQECTETFQEGHVRSFAYFGGVPKRISYDNLKIAVAKIVGPRGDQLTDEFSRLKSHFLFAPHFCRVRRPNEKGHVEGMVGFTRRNFLVPVPSAESWEALNASLEERCRQDLTRQLRGKSATKDQILEEERSTLLSLPARSFESRRTIPVRSNSLSLIRFDRNDYSVPTAYAHRELVAVGGIDDVKVVWQDQVVATHPRCWDKHRVLFNPLHYLALLERKPGAFDYARPLEEWDLPDAFAILRRRMEAVWNAEGTRHYIKVLRLLEQASVEELHGAIVQALSHGANTSDAVRVLLEQRRELAVPLFPLEGRPHLKGVTVPTPDLSAYHVLCEGGVS
jgi:transposase